MKDIFKISVGGGGWSSGSQDGGAGGPGLKKIFPALQAPLYSLGDPPDRHWILVLNNYWVTQYNCPLLNGLFYIFIFK